MGLGFPKGPLVPDREGVVALSVRLERSSDWAELEVLHTLDSLDAVLHHEVEVDLDARRFLLVDH